MICFRHKSTNDASRPIRCGQWAIGLIVVLCDCLYGQETSSHPIRITTSTSIIENAPAGTVLEDLRNSHPELSHFELVPENRELPIRVSRDGELSVSDSSLLNFEQRNLWVLTIRARQPRDEDPYLLDFVKSLENQNVAAIEKHIEELQTREVVLSVRVHVIDQDETPVVADTSLTLHQDQPMSVPGRVEVVEADRHDGLEYSITCSTNEQCFAIDPKSGKITFRNPDRFDWTRPRQAIEVEVRDQRGNSARSIVELNVVASQQRMAADDESNFTADGLVPRPIDATIEPGEAAVGPTYISEVPPADSVTEPANAQLQPSKSNGQFDHHHLSAQFAPGTLKNEPATNKSDETLASIDAAINGSPARLATETTQETTPVTTGTGDQTLDDAARNIEAGTSSGVALNESVDDRNGATKVVRSAPTRKAIVRDESTVEIRGGVQRSPAQLFLFFSAFTAIAVAVFLHYKRARQARLDAMKPSQEEAESRLDHYMAAHTKAHESAEEPAETVPAKPAQAPEPTSQVDDPDAAFDPESLIDDSMLEAAPLSSMNEHVEPSGLEQEQKKSATPDNRVASKPNASALLLLSEDLLADEILSPPKVSQDAIDHARDQLEAVTARLEQRTEEPAEEPRLNGDWNFQDTRQWLPAEKPSGTSDATETAIEDSLATVMVADEVDEPSYELIWDPEVQRYIKVERPAKAEIPEYESVGLPDASEIEETSSTKEFVLDPTSAKPEITDSSRYEPEEPPSERVQSLRAELADLFNLHAATTSQARQQGVIESSTTESNAYDAPDVSEKSPEENHLDSVAKYLSQLLERSKKEEPSDIFVDRRKSQSGVWDGEDRRNRPKPATKSYIETYLEQHGGQLEADMASLRKSSKEIPEPSEPAGPPRERKPVDVNTLRQHMESFRAVAERSVESAIATYQVRTAKGRLVGRSMLIGGLVIVVGLGIGTNVFRKFHLQPLNWLICAFILLCVAEFFLRVESIRQHRREMRLRILSAQKPAEKSITEPGTIAAHVSPSNESANG